MAQMTDNHKIIRRLGRRAQSLTDALTEINMDSLPEEVKDDFLSAWGFAQEASGNLWEAEQKLKEAQQ